MDFCFYPDLIAFRSIIARWVDERLAPRADALDRSGQFPRDLFKELGQMGYYGILYPESHGGSGLDKPYRRYTVLCEEPARVFSAGRPFEQEFRRRPTAISNSH